MIEFQMPLVYFAQDPKFLKQTMNRIGTEAVQKARKSIASSSGGPGNPPMKETGALMKSIGKKVSRDGLGLKLFEGLGNTYVRNGKNINAYYGKMLEVGAQNVGRPKKGAGVLNKHGKLVKRRGTSSGIIAPRPFLEPAALAVLSNIEQRISKAIEEGLSLRQVK